MKPTNPTSTVSTRKVTTQGALTLVEWLEGDVPRRNWVTPDMVVGEGEDGAILVRNPRAGPPYGVDFSRSFTLQITPRDLDRELKKRDIWTIQDIRARPNEVLAALRTAYGIDLAEILNWARAHEKEMGSHE